MKWTVSKNKYDEPENIIPEVGQAWRHTFSDTVYIRISDEVGEKVSPVMHNLFYSINELGKVVSTVKNKGDIILLDMTFTEKE